jgi:hypothetical protein
MYHRHYCLYCIDETGKIRRAHDIFAFTDMSAIAQAEVMRRTAKAVLLEEERQVRVFKDGVADYALRLRPV